MQLSREGQDLGYASSWEGRDAIPEDWSTLLPSEIMTYRFQGL